MASEDPGSGGRYHSFEQGRKHAKGEARIIGGGDAPTEPDGAWERDPLLTMRDGRRLFWVWLPISLLGGLAVGLFLLRFGLSLALVGMLAIQTGGFLATYLVAYRRRTDPLRRKPSGREDG